MPVSPADFLLGIVLPAVLAGLLLLGARRAAWGPGAGAALAVGVAFVVAHQAQRGWRGVPPTEATDWAWVAAAGGALLGAVGLTRRGPPAVRVPIRMLAAAGLMWCLLASWRAGVDASTARTTITVLAVATAVVWSVLEVPQAAPSWFTPAVAALTAAGAAGAIGMSGSGKLALLAGALCAVLAAAAVASGLRLAPPSLPGAAAPFSLTLAALLACASWFSELPRSSALLVAAAPCASLLPSAALGERARRPAVLALLLLLAAALLAAAVKVAIDASPSWEGLDY